MAHAYTRAQGRTLIRHQLQRDRLTAAATNRQGRSKHRVVRIERRVQDIGDMPLSTSARLDPDATVGPSTPALRVSGLCVRYPIKRGLVIRRTIGHVDAVREASFEIRPGQTLGLVGESGCGKSSLARAIVGIHRPSAGTVEVNGIEATPWERRTRRTYSRSVQMIFQDPYTSLDPRMSVETIVTEPLRIHRALARRQITSKCRELLDRVGLAERFLRRYPHELSGGQRQRVAVARALALQPSVIIADEPTSALDASVQSQVLNLLGELQRDLGLALLFISHDLGVVRYLSSDIAVMHLGEIVEHGGAHHVFDEAQHPYTTALLSARPVPDPDVQQQRRRIVLEGEPASPANPPPGCRFHTRCWLRPSVDSSGRCQTEVPVLVSGARDTHRVACHYSDGP